MDEVEALLPFALPDGQGLAETPRGRPSAAPGPGTVLMMLPDERLAGGMEAIGFLSETELTILLGPVRPRGGAAKPSGPATGDAELAF